MKVVIALGGNMISDASNKSETFSEQQSRITTSAKIISDIIEQGHEVIITHGNGPQVGSLLLQQQAQVNGAVELPLKVLGALTQGQIGVLLQHALLNELKRRGISRKVVVIPTSVIVDKDDPGFDHPTKPVGPIYTEEEYKRLAETTDYEYTNTGSGYRRVVASPQPLEILEVDTIASLFRDQVVIACGGGGTPTINGGDYIRIEDAVIDKDLASSLLANRLDADMFLILTNVDGVYKNFNSADRELVTKISKSEAEALISSAEVTKGSMEPKVRAALNFKGETIITSPEYALQALQGEAGTHITKD